MRFFYLLHILLYSYLIYWGKIYLEMEAGVISQLDSTTGTYHFSPIVSYLENWILFSIGTMCLAGFFYRKEKTRTVAKILGGVTTYILTIVCYIYWFEPLEKENIMQSKQSIFWFLGMLQILVALFLIWKDWLIELVQTKLKYFFFITGILYIGILFLAFYSVELRNSILSVIRDQGRSNYEGMHPNFPLHLLWFALNVTLLITTTILFSLASSIIEENSNTVAFQVTYILMTGCWLVLLFSTVLMLACGDISLRRIDTPEIIIYTITFILPPFVLALMTENKTRKKASIPNSNILDDSFY